MPKAITTDPKRCNGLPTLTGTRILVSDVLAYLANRSGLAEPQAGVSAMLNELAELYSHPPAPSPSIEVAAKEIARASCKFWRNTMAGESAVPEIRDILTRHFGTAILAAAGEKGQDDEPTA